MNNYGEINWELLLKIGAAGSFALAALFAMAFGHGGWSLVAFLISCLIIFLGIEGAISSLVIYAGGFIVSLNLPALNTGACVAYAIVTIILLIIRAIM